MRTRLKQQAAGKSGRMARKEGFALITVLFVLLALLVLCTPFVMTARNANEASSQVADRARLGLALDSASTHARARLGATHPALDSTVDYDTLDELTVDNEFPDGFINANDWRGVMWDLDVDNVASFIDLNSASPQVIANIMGLVTHLSKPLTGEEDEIRVANAATFDPEGGYIWIAGEFIHYSSIEGSSLMGCQRGLGHAVDEDGATVSRGPRAASNHGLGSPVLDQRVFAMSSWRRATVGGRLRHFDADEQVRDCDPFALNEDVGEAHYRDLDGLTSVYGSVGAGAMWQAPVRLIGSSQRNIEDDPLAITVDRSRWFTVGATVLISDGGSSEVRLVQRRGRNGSIILDEVLDREYRGFTGTVRVLSKRPVNLNTAPAAVLRVLFLNLQVAGRNQRITDGAARALAGMVIAARPLEGHEDFMRRVVLPAAGMESQPGAATTSGGMLTPTDAVALYRNGLNANDGRLAYATMPFCYTAKDVYAMEVRASINAKSGVERVAAVRSRVELIAPQSDLFVMWHRQKDFDEAFRLNREAPWWMTGPEPVTRYDGTTVPPSRFWPHFGTLGGQPFVAGLSDPQMGSDGEPQDAEHVFPSLEEDDAFAQLFPARHYETGIWAGRVMHFDQESRDLEGRYLPDQTITIGATDSKVLWASGDGNLCKPMTFEAWIKPRSTGDGVIFDLGNNSPDVDRITLAIEEGNLVLRVLDAFGDHRDSPEKDESEMVFPIAQGEGPGLPTDVWSHVRVDVHGNRPDQMTLLVNGMAKGVTTKGMSKLSAPLAQSQTQISLESTEGFPAKGVVRIGNELIEYVLGGDGELIAEFQEAGPDAGFGGRMARTRFEDGSEEAAPLELAALELSYPTGTMVQVYGYSLPLGSNVPNGGSELADGVGLWRVAKITAMEADGVSDVGDPIFLQGLFGPFQIGFGIEGDSARPVPFDLTVTSGDAWPETDDGVLSGFNPNGGFAALMQQQFSNDTVSMAPLGGIELIEYSSAEGGVITVIARGQAVGSRMRIFDEVTEDGDRNPGFEANTSRAFVCKWTNPAEWETRMDLGLYIIPISLPAPGAGDLTGFLDPFAQTSGAGGTFSEFAQITRETDVENTEWVRYDEIVGGQLVRNDPNALFDAYWTIMVEDEFEIEEPPEGGESGGGLADSGAGGSGGETMAASEPPPPAKKSTRVGSDWMPKLGESELENYPMTRATSKAFQFRGVFGTEIHEHPPGTKLLPVIHTRDGSPIGMDPGASAAVGLPGRGDTVFVVDSAPQDMGWPMKVHRAHRPWRTITRESWSDPEDGSMVAVDGSQQFESQLSRVRFNDVYVAFDDECPSIVAGNVGNQYTDSRFWSRLSKFPSGELPRQVGSVGIGTGFGAASGGTVPSLTIDEIVFGDPEFGTGAPGAIPAFTTRGAQLELIRSFGEGDGETLETRPKALRRPGGLYGGNVEYLDRLPEDAGLLRIGEEIVCYISRDPGTGSITLAPGGRGLLGTEPQPHSAGEPVTLLEGIPVSVIGGGLGPGDALIPLVDLEAFPSQGTVLIGQELAHFTHHWQTSLGMPATSTTPGADNNGGVGVFRGRFGTAPGAHPFGTPVIDFPFRYWDRWEDQANSPEMGYFGFRQDQPGAFWHGYFWEWEPGPEVGPRMGVLVRTDPNTPWDADPDMVEGLSLEFGGDDNGQLIPIAQQSDSVEWRVFVRYEQGSFDPEEGMAHGWKTSPRLRRIGVNFMAPSLTLRSVDR